MKLLYGRSWTKNLRRTHSTPVMAANLLPSPLLRRSTSSPLLTVSRSRRTSISASSQFRIAELLGGRGLCNGETGLQKELSNSSRLPLPSPSPQTASPPSPSPSAGEDDFEKELMGLTGGFPGGEVGLKAFIKKNPPPPKSKGNAGATIPAARPAAPELPLFLPGMIVIVKNPSNPYYMYCGTVQRVTDGMVGVLLEGGNWDKLLTFRLDELERRQKGPPMVNPRSAILEELVAAQSSVEPPSS